MVGAVIRKLIQADVGEIGGGRGRDGRAKVVDVERSVGYGDGEVEPTVDLFC